MVSDIAYKRVSRVRGVHEGQIELEPLGEENHVRVAVLTPSKRGNVDDRADTESAVVSGEGLGLSEGSGGCMGGHWLKGDWESDARNMGR
jgi:hypothetical protein